MIEHVLDDVRHFEAVAGEVRGLRDCFAQAIAIRRAQEEQALRQLGEERLVLGDTVMLDGCSSGLERELAGCGFRGEAYAMAGFKKGGGSLRWVVLRALSDGQAAGGELASCPAT